MGVVFYKEKQAHAFSHVQYYLNHCIPCGVKNAHTSLMERTYMYIYMYVRPTFTSQVRGKWSIHVQYTEEVSHNQNSLHRPATPSMRITSI